MRVLNAHTHIENLSKITASNLNCEIDYFVNGTKCDDLDRLIQLNKQPNLKCFAGLHPWKIDDQEMAKLEGFIDRALNEGLGLGEVGLDRARRGIADFEVQKRVLRLQLEAVASRQRGVVLHIVRGWGDLLEMIDSILKPGRNNPIMVHNFCSNIENCRQLIRREIFISIGQPFFTHKDAAEILKIIPVERLLVEEEEMDANICERLNMIYEKISIAKNIDKELLKNICFENGKVF
ncbi:MAG: TatD family hydrolase [Spirochaetales bacterium]|nr:TatD family hydrolase [Spirochaetales bacterium]